MNETNSGRPARRGVRLLVLDVITALSSPAVARERQSVLIARTIQLLLVSLRDTCKKHHYYHCQAQARRSLFKQECTAQN